MLSLQTIGGSATLVGMYGVVYFTGQRIAAVQMAELARQEQTEGFKRDPLKKTSSTDSVRNLDNIELTPWVNVPLKTPLMLLSSFVGAAAAKFMTPAAKTLSELVRLRPTLVYGVGLVVFSASACFYRISVKHMVKKARAKTSDCIECARVRERKSNMMRPTPRDHKANASALEPAPVPLSVYLCSTSWHAYLHEML